MFGVLSWVVGREHDTAWGLTTGAWLLLLSAGYCRSMVTLIQWVIAALIQQVTAGAWLI